MPKWTTELTVKFVPLPPEKEAAFSAAMLYFAEVMFSYLIDSQKEVDEKKSLHPLERDEGLLQEAA